MNQQYLDNLANAKESLKIWFSNFEQKNIGNHMFSHENKIDREKTDFAMWYYGEGQTFSSFETFRDIEVYYNKMYDLFLVYNRLYSKPVKKSFFSNKFEKHKQALNVLFKKIEASSNELIDYVNLFQNTLIESPLFVEKEDLFDTISEEKSITEKKPDIVTELEEIQINSNAEEQSQEIGGDAIFELDKEELIEEQIPETEENPVVEEDSKANKLTEEDNSEDDIETEQIKEKKAILEISRIESEKKPKAGNFKIDNEIDIEEEIRRILN